MISQFKFIRSSFLLAVSIFSVCSLNAQTAEWKLIFNSYSNVDPDGAGPAKGTFTVKMQIRTTSGTIADVNAISTGWAYQSSAAAIPTTPGCTILSNPANVSISPEFTAGGFTYTTVNQCFIFNQTTGGQTFDRVVIGTLDGTDIDITSNWTDVMTITMWSLGTSCPEGGRMIMNSSALGSPGTFSNYAVSDAFANEYAANSATYTTPLEICAAALPVYFSTVSATCRGNGTLISWTTEQELNSSHFEVQRSISGTDWTRVGSVAAAGNSNTRKNYQLMVPQTGKAMFRINQVDIGGQSMISPVSAANCEEGGTASSSFIYPVPAKDVINVRVNADKSGVAQLTVMDATGRKVRGKAAGLISGMNTISINVSGLAGGTYSVLIAEESGKTEVIKFIKE